MTYKLACEKNKNRIDNKKGSTGRRIIRTINGPERQLQYHATKGWKGYRK